jgi:hypothetical protein
MNTDAILAATIEQLRTLLPALRGLGCRLPAVEGLSVSSSNSAVLWLAGLFERISFFFFLFDARRR